MNGFEKQLSEKLGERTLDKIRSVRVGIAGAGGLGSNCAFNLVRCGFRDFKIADLDVVELSNLNRQFYFFDQAGMKKVDALKENLIRINPDINVETFCGRIDAGNVGSVLGGCDIVVEAFDKAEDKKMLVENMTGRALFVAIASGLAGIGHSDDIRVQRIRDDMVLIGDLKSDSGKMAPISPRVNVAAAKQADEILAFVLELNKKGSWTV